MTGMFQIWNWNPLISINIISFTGLQYLFYDFTSEITAFLNNSSTDRVNVIVEWDQAVVLAGMIFWITGFKKPTFKGILENFIKLIVYSMSICNEYSSRIVSYWF
jgi:hypothetical protein